MLKANKGEWSELFVFLSIIDSGRVSAADNKADPIEDQFYEFIEIIREDLGTKKTYSIKTDSVEILDKDRKSLKVISTIDLSTKTKSLLDRIKNSSGSSFVVPEINDLMNEFQLESIKANSSSKADLIAVIHDRIANKKPELGFSIKSQLGGASTLLNASSHTNFTFRVEGEVDSGAINSIFGKRKIRDRLAAIEDSGASLVFCGVDSSSFKSNMRLIDSSFPEIIGMIMLDYYRGMASSIDSLCERAKEFSYANSEGNEISYKLKSFLRSIALGMVPSKKWDTYLSAYGGYIIVKEDGQIVCYHLYNDDEFKDYLFNNTKLESPSSTRHKYGTVYSDGESDYIKLNLQIRFK